MNAQPATLDSATHRAAMIARAELRRARLEELAEVGIALAKEIAVRMIDGPYHPEPRNDPGRSYATVSRSVRLTFALQATVDRQILALLDGDTVPVEAPKAASVRAPQPSVAPRKHDEGRECLVESERPDLPDFTADLETPSSPEVSMADSRRSAASLVGIGREAGTSGALYEDDSREDLAVPSPRSRPEGESRPPHFGEGRMVAEPAVDGCADPPSRE